MAKRFATVAIAAATAASLAVAPAHAADTSSEINTSLEKVNATIGSAAGSIAAPVIAPLAKLAHPNDDKAAAQSTVGGAAIVSLIAMIAAPIVAILGIYDFAVKQGWIKPVA